MTSGGVASESESDEVPEDSASERSISSASLGAPWRDEGVRGGGVSELLTLERWRVVLLRSVMWRRERVRGMRSGVGWVTVCSIVVNDERVSVGDAHGVAGGDSVLAVASKGSFISSALSFVGVVRYASDFFWATS